MHITTLKYRAATSRNGYRRLEEAMLDMGRI